MSKIVADGTSRLRKAMEAEVRPEIEARYKVLFQSAGWWKRWWLSRQMEAEIRRAVARRMPGRGLYSSVGLGFSAR